MWRYWSELRLPYHIGEFIQIFSAMRIGKDQSSVAVEMVETVARN